MYFYKKIFHRDKFPFLDIRLGLNTTAPFTPNSPYIKNCLQKLDNEINAAVNDLSSIASNFLFTHYKPLSLADNIAHHITEKQPELLQPHNSTQLPAVIKNTLNKFPPTLHPFPDDSLLFVQQTIHC